MHFIMLYVPSLVKVYTWSWVAKLLFISSFSILHSVVWILLIWVILVIIYYHFLVLWPIRFISESDCICPVVLFISFENLKLSKPNVIIKPTSASVSSIIGHKLPIIGHCNLLVRDDKSSILNCEFLVTDCGPSTLDPDNLRIIQGQLSLLTTEGSSDETLDSLLTT